MPSLSLSAPTPLRPSHECSHAAHAAVACICLPSLRLLSTAAVEARNNFARRSGQMSPSAINNGFFHAQYEVEYSYLNRQLQWCREKDTDCKMRGKGLRLFGNDEQQAAVEQLMKHAHEQCVEHTVRSGGARAQTSSMFKRSTLFIWAAVYTAVRGRSKQTLRARCLFALTLSSSTHAPHHRARTTRLTCTKMPCALAFTTRAPPQAPAPSPSLTPGAPTDSSCCLAREADCPTTKNSLSQPRHSTTRFESVNRLLAGSYCAPLLPCLQVSSPATPSS